MTEPRAPQTPRRNRHTTRDGVHGEEVLDNGGDLQFHLIIPAQLAREVKWSYQMSPTRRRTDTGAAPSPVMAPLPLARQGLPAARREAPPAARREAPISPPPSPLPPHPTTPAPVLATRVPLVAPPQVSRCPALQFLDISPIHTF